jgi:hypothetical protein
MLAFGVCASLPMGASGQAVRMNAPSGSGATRDVEALELPDPGSPEMEAYRQMQKRRVDLERELRKIRAGIQRLRDFTDPAVFPSLLEIFRREGDDVREAIIDHLAALDTEESDATLAWTSVFDEDKEIRRSARERLLERKREWQGSEVPRSVQSVVATGLRRNRSNDEIGAAAQLARDLRLYDAIPMMINAQANTAGRSSRGDGALAYILVGKQQTFVADLQPVVGDSAVGFDPQIAVLTEGVVMVVEDAAVVTYHWEVHHALVDLSSAGWGGRSTRRFGFNGEEWRKWYEDEFLPYRRGLAQAEQTEQDPAGGG